MIDLSIVAQLLPSKSNSLKFDPVFQTLVMYPNETSSEFQDDLWSFAQSFSLTTAYALLTEKEKDRFPVFVFFQKNEKTWNPNNGIAESDFHMEIVTIPIAESDFHMEIVTIPIDEFRDWISSGYKKIGTAMKNLDKFLKTWEGPVYTGSKNSIHESVHDVKYFMSTSVKVTRDLGRIAYKFTDFLEFSFYYTEMTEVNEVPVSVRSVWTNLSKNFSLSRICAVQQNSVESSYRTVRFPIFEELYSGIPIPIKTHLDGYVEEFPILDMAQETTCVTDVKDFMQRLRQTVSLGNEFYHELSNGDILTIYPPFLTSEGGS